MAGFELRPLPDGATPRLYVRKCLVCTKDIVEASYNTRKSVVAKATSISVGDELENGEWLLRKWLSGASLIASL